MANDKAEMEKAERGLAGVMDRVSHLLVWHAYMALTDWIGYK